MLPVSLIVESLLGCDSDSTTGSRPNLKRPATAGPIRLEGLGRLGGCGGGDHLSSQNVPGRKARQLPPMPLTHMVLDWAWVVPGGGEGAAAALSRRSGGRGSRSGSVLFTTYEFRNWHAARLATELRLSKQSGPRAAYCATAGVDRCGHDGSPALIDSIGTPRPAGDWRWLQPPA